MNSRLQREIDFHDKTYEDDTRDVVSKYYSITKTSSKFYQNFLLNHAQDSKILEYGCGEGSYGFVLAENGANVTGIDISSYAIDQAKKIASEESLDINFLVMDAEELNFDDSSFDLICGTGILHHLNLNKAYKEIARTLTKDGHAIFIEPLGHNIFINLFRKLTPNLRTEDEHPFLAKDIKFLNRFFNTVELKHFHLFSLASVPFRKLKIFPYILSFFNSMDTFFLRIFPFIRRYTWMVVITLSQPIK